MAVMKKIRDGLLGNFIPLGDAARAVGARILVSDEEADVHLSLNRPSDEVVQAQRAAVAYHLRFAHGASRLLQLLNRPADSRPKRYDAAAGYPILDDTLGRRGVNILNHWAKLAYPSASKASSGARSTVPFAHNQGPDGNPLDLGFDVDELIHFLNAGEVPHTLGDQLNSVEGEKPAGLIANDPSAANGPKPRFTGPLREVLLIAWEKARDGDDHVAVFAELCEMAKAEKPRAPLRCYEDGGIWYDDPETASGRVFLTVDKLMDRAFFKNKASRKKAG